MATDASDATDSGSIALFGPCQTDDACDQTGNGRCLTVFPVPFCTRDCNTNSDCGNHGTCFAGTCIPACTTGGLECDQYGSACAITDQAHPESSRGCLGACVPGSDAGVNSCRGSGMCDPYVGFCTDMAAPGADNGDPCTTDNDCRSGTCFPETTTAGPTGYIGGYCVSNGRVPSSSALTGTTLPQSTCPDGSAILPDTGQVEGDVGTCYKTCATTQDCRAGYACTLGICTPEDCSAAGNTCPSGYSCLTLGMAHICAHPSGTDGGMNPDSGAVDASTDVGSSG
jgi:hypothetical protein